MTNGHVVIESYDVIRDFEPVSRLVLVPQVFTVPKSSPANDLHEFIKYAKASDGSLNFGSSGQGGITHLPMVMLMHNEDFTMTHIPYKGGAQVVVEALAERIDATIVTVSSVQQHINSGALKGLAVSSPTRLPALPNVPTFDELGIKDVNAVFNIGLAVPKGTPAEIIEKIASDSREILSNPEFQKQYLNPYSYLVVGSTPEEFKTWIEEDLKEQGERITISGASLD